MGKTLPAKQWILLQQPDGSLLSTLYDYRDGFVKHYSAVQIERGDVLHFYSSPELQYSSPALHQDHVIHVGDTLGVIQSHEVSIQLRQLERELESAKASLQLNRVGEKEALINEAQQQLELAREESAIQTRLFNRQDSLYQKNLISQEVYELTKSNKKIAALELAIASAHLQVLQTGAKPELIRFYEREIVSLEKEIDVLKKKEQDYTLTSPISGRVFQHFSGDTLLIIGDTTSVMLMPIDVGYFSDIKRQQKVIFQVPNSHKECFGTLIRMERSINILNRKQVFLAFATIENADTDLPFHLIIPCTIQIEELKIIPYLYKMLNSFFQ